MYACIAGDVTGTIKPVYNIKDGKDANHKKNFLMTIKLKLKGFDGKEGGSFSIMDGVCEEGKYGSNFWHEGKVGPDPFPVYFNTNKKGKSVKKKVKVNNGYSKDKNSAEGKNAGKIFVVYDSEGDVVGCGEIMNEKKEDC